MSDVQMGLNLSDPANAVAGRQLLKFNGDPGCLRPWLGRDGNNYITINGASDQPQVLRTNASSTMSKDDWELLDEAVVRVAKQRLRAWKHLMENNLRFDIPNGMAKTVLQYQNLSDITPATLSMSGLRQSDSDRPIFDLVNLPLPIAHKDFSFDAREVMASRTSANFMGGGAGSTTPLDTTTAELASRRVAEQVEQLLLGTLSTYTFGGGSIYGYCNFPSRATKSMTAPTGSNSSTTLNEVLAMKLLAQQMYHFGPYMMYNSLDWDPYLDGDYQVFTVGGSNYGGQLTLRERIAKIDGIMGCMTVDYLPVKTMVLVQMTPDVVRGVTGMQITTVNWETHGGFDLNFKVLCIMVPQLRADHNGNTGIVHGTHA